MTKWSYAVALAFTLLPIGAKATGPDVTLPQIPPGKAMLVLYRTGGIKGMFLGCSIRDGDDLVAHLAPSHYATAVVEPGMHQLSIAGRGAFTINVAADQAQYVRCKIGGALMAAPPHLETSDPGEFHRAAPSLKPSTP